MICWNKPKSSSPWHRLLTSSPCFVGRRPADRVVSGTRPCWCSTRETRWRCLCTWHTRAWAAGPCGKCEPAGTGRSCRPARQTRPRANRPRQDTAGTLSSVPFRLPSVRCRCRPLLPDSGQQGVVVRCGNNRRRRLQSLTTIYWAIRTECQFYSLLILKGSPPRHYPFTRNDWRDLRTVIIYWDLRIIICCGRHSAEYGARTGELITATHTTVCVIPRSKVGPRSRSRSRGLPAGSSCRR